MFEPSTYRRIGIDLFPHLRLGYTIWVVNAFVKISAALLDASHDFIIVTPNERLARELRRGLNQAHQAQELRHGRVPNA